MHADLASGRTALARNAAAPTLSLVLAELGALRRERNGTNMIAEAHATGTSSFVPTEPLEAPATDTGALAIKPDPASLLRSSLDLKIRNLNDTSIGACIKTHAIRIEMHQKRQAHWRDHR